VRIALISVDVKFASAAGRLRTQSRWDCAAITRLLVCGVRADEIAGLIETAAEATHDALECETLAGIGVSLH